MALSKPEEEFALQCRADGLKPEREYRFHPERRWRFDFCWPYLMLAVEIEGGIWQGGRHQTGMGFTKDCEKYAEAAIIGFNVMRFTPAQVKSGYAIDCVKRFIQMTKEN